MNYPIIQTATGTADRSRFFITIGAKNKKTGASELAVFSHVFGLDLEKIREDVSVTIGGHRYEPDLAYIDKKMVSMSILRLMNPIQVFIVPLISSPKMERIRINVEINFSCPQAGMYAVSRSSRCFARQSRA